MTTAATQQEEETTSESTDVAATAVCLTEKMNPQEDLFEDQLNEVVLDGSSFFSLTFLSSIDHDCSSCCCSASSLVLLSIIKYY